MSFAEILSEFESSRRQETGPRQGTVVAVTADSVLVDIGLKTEGVLPLESFLDANGKAGVECGDLVTVTITGRDAGGYYTLSMLKAEKPKDWSGLEAAFASGKAIGGTVTGVIKGGLNVDVGVRAFMPASRSGARDAAELEQLVGQEIQCKIIKLDVADEDVVVDRRAVLAEEEARRREAVLASLQEGAELSGTVRTVTDFGAFVDLGGVDGLLHVSDMSWGRIEKPSDFVKAGDVIKVKILKVDAAGRRVSLGTKQLSADPWILAGEKYKAGDRVRGTVTRLADFGAFVELEPGVEGLIRMADMSWSRKFRKPADVVQQGEMVEVVVTSVAAADRRIGLSLKQALGDPWQDAISKYPVGAVVEGPVTSLAEFGAFVEIAEGVEGMIHVGDISGEKRLKHPKEVLAAGQRVRAQVLEIDRSKRRIRLGMKQLEPTSADEYIAEHKVGDRVTGRVLESGPKKVRVELGDGVVAVCRMPSLGGKDKETAGTADGKADLASMTAMLAARWKEGARFSAGAKPGAVRAGEVRTFRIAALDAANKTIEVELAD